MNRWICGMLIGMAIPSLLARAEDFRIETQVYSGRQSKLVSENLTLFTDQIVYDFLFDQNDSTKTSEIVIYELDKNRFVLLDVDRQLKLEIRQEDLSQLLTSLKTSEPWRDQYPFLLEPAFETNYDEPSQRLEMTSKHISYSVKVETPVKSLAFPAYGQFVDAYAQLNATDPQKLPPFARLELNRELKERRLIPTQVEMTMDFPNQGSGSLRITATSKHSVIWQLSKNDHERIDTANKYWTRFRQVGLADYRRMNAETAARRTE